MTIRRVSLVALFLALAGLVALPNGVQAQDQPAQPGDQASFSNLIEALNNTQAQVRALEQQNVQDVQLANVENIRQNIDDNKKQRLDKALEQANTDKLHKALQENQAVNRALEEAQEDVSVDDVVAVDALGEGGAVVYYEPSTF